MRYTWRDGVRCVLVSDPNQGFDSGYNEDAADFIMTGYWGALNPELNQHLVALRQRYLNRLAQDSK